MKTAKTSPRPQTNAKTSPADAALFVSIAVAGIVLSGLTLALGGPRAGASAVAGATLALLNLWALRSVVAVLVQAAAGGARAHLGFFVVPKVIALLGFVWLVLARHLVDAGPLALGYAALPIGVAIAALVCKKAA